MDTEILDLVKQIARYAKGGHLYRTVELATELEKMIARKEREEKPVEKFELQSS